MHRNTRIARGLKIGLLAGIAALTLASATQAAVIVESRTGGQNFAAYSEVGILNTNNWQSSSAKSTAPGVTAGIGSRFQTNASVGGSGVYFQVAPTLPQAGGIYTVEITHTLSNAGLAVTSTITQIGGTGLPATTTAFSQPGANTWELIGTLDLNDGVTVPTVRFDETANDNRLYADAVRFTPVAPNKVTNPGPANGAIEQGLGQDISWTPGTINNFNYDVFFGTDPIPTAPVADNTTATTFDPGILNPETTYFWRVDANNADGVAATGDIYSFTTHAVPEPGTASLLGLGLMLFRRRRSR